MQVSRIILEDELLFGFFVCLHKSSSNKSLHRMPGKRLSRVRASLARHR